MKLNQEQLNKQAKEILTAMEERGLHTNFFFRTTFQRYTVQLSILSALEKEIRKSGALVKKEYVKGRKNVYTNPAIAEYNKTVAAANGTVGTLINILNSMEATDPDTGGKLRRLLDAVGDDDA